MKRTPAMILLVLATAFAAAAQDQYAFTPKASVNLRKAPSANAAKAGTLEKGVMLPLLDQDFESGWNKVEYKGEPVYVSQSVSEVCDAVIPAEIYGKSLDSTGPLDKIRIQGSITMTPLDKKHVLIDVTWMRTNLPADTWNYMAEKQPSGALKATHSLPSGYIDSDQPLAAIMEDASPLDAPIWVGFDEFNNTVYFDGAVYSEYE